MSDGQDTSGNITAAGSDRLSIGARLAAARNDRGLNLRAVASELNLDVGIIEALENDDEAALPAAIFVKGYLRNYARLVGLPEDEMVSDYSAQTGELPPLTVATVEDSSPLIRLPSTRLLRNIILVLLAVILTWLSYPFIEKLISARGQETQQTDTGRLELPPVNQPTVE